MFLPPRSPVIDPDITRQATASRVDPFNYLGRVHFGPAYIITGPHRPRLTPGSRYIVPRTGALIVPDF